MELKKFFLAILILSFFSFANSTIVQDPGLANSITEPAEPLNTSTNFTISNSVALTDIAWTSFQNIDNGDFELGTFGTTSSDWNGGKTQTGAGSYNLLYDNRLISNASLCVDGTYCGEAKRTTGATFYIAWWLWPLTTFSYKDKIRFDINVGDNPGDGTIIRLKVYESGKPIPAVGASALPDSSVTYTNTYAENSGTYRDINFTMAKNWDNNIYTIFEAVSTNGTPQTTAYIYVDNVEKSTAYNTFTIPTDADCNSSFNSAPFVPMPYNPSTGKYEVNFTSPGTAGDYNYAVTCKSGTTISYTQGIIQVRVLYPGNIEISDIENISHTINNYNVDLIPSDESEDFRFSATNLYSSSMIIDYNIPNSLDDGRQYYIYTSTTDGPYTFNDTLTYGGTYPIQKIWNNTLEKYVYSFQDTLLTGQTKYYKLMYAMPLRSWKTISDSEEWLTQLKPTISEKDGQNWEVYALSNINNMRNYFLLPLPYTDQSAYRSFEVQFTAYTYYGTATINTGMVRGDNLDTIYNNDSAIILVNETPKRFSLTFTPSDISINNRLVIYTNITGYSSLFLTDFSINGRSYFSKKLNLKSADNSELPRIVIGEISSKYVQENNPFKAVSQLYDFEGDINSLLVEAFLDSTSSANRIKQDYMPIDIDREEFYDIDYLMDNFVDLNGSNSRVIELKFTVLDSNNIPMSTQSEWVKFLQFPYFAGDIQTYAVETKQKIGDIPEGKILVETICPECFNGVLVKIWNDGNTYSSPTYTELLDKSLFNYELGEFTLDYKLSNFAFSRETLYHFAFVSLLTTRYPNLAQDSNLGVYYTDVYVQLKQFTTARIFQLRERTSTPHSIYNSTEKIPFVLELQDEEKRNLKNSINVHAYISICQDQNGGSCTFQDKKYYPSSFIYDEKDGYNYYFFDQYLTTAQGNLLPDGNYIRIYAVATFVQDDYNSFYLPLLTNKCKDSAYGDDFTGSALGMFLDPLAKAFSSGMCAEGYFQEKVVSFSVNPSQEDRLYISNSYTPTAPTQGAFVCVNTDQNNLYSDALKQKITCVVFGGIGEKQIDSLKLTITNNNSDLSDSQYPQYIQVQIPYEYLLFAQPKLLKSFMSARGTSIITVGDAVQEGLNYVLANSTNIVVDVLDATTITGAVTNIGYDVNLSREFSPAYIGYLLFYEIEGLKVVNVYDYLGQEATTKPTKFIRYASENKIKLPKDATTTITVLGSDFQQILKFKQDNYLVINQEPDESTIKATSSEVPYQTAPTILTFNIISDLLYNNQMEIVRRYVPIKLRIVVGKQEDPFVCFKSEGKILECVGSWITSFIIRNAFILFIVTGLVMVFVYISLLWRKGK